MVIDIGLVRVKIIVDNSIVFIRTQMAKPIDCVVSRGKVTHTEADMGKLNWTRANQRERSWRQGREVADRADLVHAASRELKKACRDLRRSVHQDLNEQVHDMVMQAERYRVLVSKAKRREFSTKGMEILRALASVDLRMISRKNTPRVYWALIHIRSRSEGKGPVRMTINEAKTLAQWLNQKQISG